MRRAAAILLVLVLLIGLTVPVAAADDEPGFLGGAMNAIANFFRSLIEAIKDLGRTIKDWLIKAMEYLLKGLKTLFIPKDDFFPRIQERLNTAVKNKFGGILSMGNYLKTKFSKLKAYQGELFTIKFPVGHLLGGISMDIMQGADGMLGMVRGALSGFLAFATAIYAYHRVKEMIDT